VRGLRAAIELRSDEYAQGVLMGSCAGATLTWEDFGGFECDGVCEKR
jgi:hypothetical protein